jgi:hypothetical protein
MKAWSSLTDTSVVKTYREVKESRDVRGSVIFDQLSCKRNDVDQNCLCGTSVTRPPSITNSLPVA